MAELAVWTEPLAESNCYFLHEEGACVVIDPNHPQGPLAVLEEHGWVPEWILLTHEHCDHMAGMEAVRERYPSVRVLASAACSIGLTSTRLNMSRMMEVYLTYLGKPGEAYPAFTCRPADVTYERTYEMVWRGHTLRCISLPGHTPGSAGIFWDESCFFSGDYLLPDREVILRLPGGSEHDYKTKTKPFLDGLPSGLRICPGHGAPYRLGERSGEPWTSAP